MKFYTCVYAIFDYDRSVKRHGKKIPFNRKSHLGHYFCVMLVLAFIQLWGMSLKGRFAVCVSVVQSNPAFYCLTGVSQLVLFQQGHKVFHPAYMESARVQIYFCLFKWISQTLPLEQIREERHGERGFFTWSGGGCKINFVIQNKMCPQKNSASKYIISLIYYGIVKQCGALIEFVLTYISPYDGIINICK